MQDMKNEHERERDSNEKEERGGEHLPPWVLCFSFEQGKKKLPDK